MDKFLKDIKDTNTVCIFVSPHFDDAIFSAGGLMQTLVGWKSKVVLVNVFTKAGCVNTLSANAYLRQVGYKSATRLYKDREAEDRAVSKSLGVVPNNLGFVEALWRKKKTNVLLSKLSKIAAEFSAMYPTYRWHVASGKLSLEDEKTVEAIKNKLLKLVSNNRRVVFFAPLAIGGHVDHLAVKVAVARLNLPAFYWADYPYVLDLKRDKTGRKFSIRPDWARKEQLIKGYVSQFAPIFGKKKIQRISEDFYTI